MDILKRPQKIKTPIWFMRQAGRYLPEYKKIRKKNENFLDMCFSPTIASEISLQPIKRFDLDFIILFSDILVIPFALDQKVTFKEKIGPVLNIINSKKDLKYSSLKNIMIKLKPVFETLQILKEEKKNKRLIGFCGGPFTVLTYMIEGGTSTEHLKIRRFLSSRREEMDELIDLLTEVSIEYLRLQILSGADVIQVFDSWAGLLDMENYEEYVMKPSKRIYQEIKKEFPQTPVIFFPRGSGGKLVDFINYVECDAISLDEKFPQELVGISERKKIILQGNLSPKSLLEGGDKMEQEIRNCMQRFKNNLHIFNLSHGVLPSTPPENIERTIELVREFDETN